MEMLNADVQYVMEKPSGNLRRRRPAPNQLLQGFFGAGAMKRSVTVVVTTLIYGMGDD
jgi:hypothetical protein